MRFFSRSGDARARWTPGRRNSSLSSTGPADTFPYSPSERSGSEDELWGALEQRSSAEGDGDNVAAGVMGRDGSKHACRDVSVGTAARRAMPPCNMEGFGAALAATGRSSLHSPPPCMPLTVRGSSNEAHRQRVSPANSATGSACSNGSPSMAADLDARNRRHRTRRRHSGGNISTPLAWEESSESAAQQMPCGDRRGSTRTNTSADGTPVNGRTPARTRHRPSLSMCEKPRGVFTPLRPRGSKTPPKNAPLSLVDGATGSRASGAYVEGTSFTATHPQHALPESAPSCRMAKLMTPGRKARNKTAAAIAAELACAQLLSFPPTNSGSATSKNSNHATMVPTTQAPPTPPPHGEGSIAAFVGPPPPINTRPYDEMPTASRSVTPGASVCTPPMVRPPPPATTAPSPPAPPPPSQKAPSPPAGVDTGGGPRGVGSGGGLRAPEPPPIQAPLPPTSAAEEASDSAPLKWSSGGDGPAVSSGGGAVASGGGGQGLGLGPALGLELGLVLGQGQGQGQGAPEGFRPPRLRMLSNPGTLSNPGGCRAAVARYNDKRQSYKFSDKGALTLKNYGLRIGRGGVRDYSEEVLSPTGHNGNGTVGPFFSSSGGGDIWVEVPPDAMSANVVRLEELGHGATGSVYKAVHATTLQLLAVKEVPVHDKSRRDQIGAELRLLKHCREDAAARARATEGEGNQSDANQAASGGSPSSLVAFYDAFTLTRSGYVSIVMEYCSGGSLQDLINRQGPLDEASIASIAFDMAQGLHYMHSLNMLHRDIKPANILLDREGRVKLADFGLVRSLDDADAACQSGVSAGGDCSSGSGGGSAAPASCRRARAHSFVGTAMYMSPERLQGEPYGPEADVWSLGLTLLTLAIGRYPLEIPKNNLYWNLVKLVCPQISSFHSGIASSSGGSTEYVENGSTPAEGGGVGVYDSSGNRPGSEVFRSVPRSSRRDPMSVFLPQKREAELQLSEAFMSFLRGCLRYDMEERMTAQDMLKHPFLQVPPSKRGIALASGRGVAAAAARDRDRATALARSACCRKTDNRQRSNVVEQAQKRDEYAERVLGLTGILSAVARFHMMNAKGGRRRSRSHLYLSGPGTDNPPLGCSTQNSGYSAMSNYTPMNANVLSSQDVMTMPLMEHYPTVERGDTSSSAQNGESGAGGGGSLKAVIEEPPLDDDAFRRLGDHVGVHPVVVEAVWRDEWVRQVEAEAQAEAALVMERERERERDFVRDQCLDTGEADVLLEEEVCMVALDRLPTTTMVKRNRGAKLDE